VATINTTGLTLVSTDRTSRKDVGSGEWLVHGWTNDGSALLGIRKTSQRKLELVQLDSDSGSERVLADLGRVPAAYSYAATLGAAPLRGFVLAADGKSFLTSVVRPTSDLWVMDRRR
ncbi:MAG TPA: hypothetical protein VEX68_10060, partial [Bryobacteraceae bacterium]|nr:hypothetical protein [Bryobacteraceae bacterium]